jgi:hypothetical protein
MDAVAAVHVMEEESSFLKKRSKRLLFLRSPAYPVHRPGRWHCLELKVFWFFFQKRTLSF